MRHRLHLETPVDTPDGAGGVTRNWSPVSALWGQIEALRADETISGDGVDMSITYRMTIRYRTQIDGTMRLSMGERLFAIRGIRDPNGYRHWLEILAEEIRA